MNDLLKYFDIAKTVEEARGDAARICRLKFRDYVRGKMIEAHNIKVRIARARIELNSQEQKLAGLLDLIRQVEAGNYENIEPLELTDKSSAAASTGPEPKEAHR